MKVGRAIKILDPYEWLPGYGENAVRIRTEATDLIATVVYDSGSGEREHELRFTSVCSFYSQVFPGPSMLNFEGGQMELILQGALIEYQDSDAAVAWSRHFGNSRTVRHYSIVFHAENLQLVVFAGGVVTSEIYK
ncbi:hypothetical protein [Burkholderia multivorans]|uniref:hypothetical protein n=1 Tax=Burkholderia multivorans TaxID=87883 RepID=UPI0009B6C104|nr:hypothetical protein [Burkholderia multivorans]MBU9310192.1 hypothetical protein [Burkholderia multivorans]MBU9575441.1 hypothetical protein [Burkholderia multivorans]MBU9661993.1 hypothetical protein [Burkholderia multivorans]MDN7950130.1 hypothetical protein [Burkholderia multivorans]MDN7963043.1 hypothetical protein [Burkholderia multivorans]